MDWDVGCGPQVARRRGFQFPSRNSMDWDLLSAATIWYASQGVSIPQSEFDGLGHVQRPDNQAVGKGVSIPQSEFDGLGHTAPPPTPSHLGRFNSPVGIRWIGTRLGEPILVRRRAVSIPQSEFDGLGPGWGQRGPGQHFGFNSPVGIRWIGTASYLRVCARAARVSIPQSEFDGLGRTRCI